MKKSIIVLLLIINILLFNSISYALEPKFRVHILKDIAPGFNYSINYPVVIDYDNDGDQDVLVISKEGCIYFLENLLIEKEGI